MQVVIFAHQDSIVLRQLSASGVVGTLPIASLGTVLSNVVRVFDSVGISDPIILCRPGQIPLLEKCIQPRITASFIEIAGTATISECLHRIRDKFTSVGCCQHVFLVYADIVITDVDLHSLFLKMVRTKSSVVALTSPYSRDAKLVKAREGNDMMMLDLDDETLVMFTAAADLKKQVRIRKSIAAAHPRLETRVDLHDVGLYLLNGYALRMLEYNRDDAGLKKGFLSHIVNVEQYRPYQFDTSNVAISNLPESLRYKAEELPKSCKVTIVIHEDKALSRRIDSPLSYLDAIKLVREKYPDTKETNAAPNCLSVGSSTDHKTPIADTIYADDCVFGSSNVFVRSCFVGARCTVGENTRIIGSALLAGVSVGDGCKITNCIIGEGVIIDDNSILKDSAIAARQHIMAKSLIQSESVGFSEIDFDE